jgi:hypothetical protein
MDAAISAPNPPVIGASWLTCYRIVVRMIGISKRCIS